MGRAARVTSIDALQTMASAVQDFRGEAVSALDDLEMEIRRALEWIHHDRKEYWSREVQHGWERVSEARVELQQATTSKRIGNDQPSCVDEKKALEKAKRRLDVAQERVEAVRRWTYAIDRAVNEYRASCAQLRNWLDADAPRALAALDRMSDTLETYVATDIGPTPSPPLPPGEENVSGTGHPLAGRVPPADGTRSVPDTLEPPGDGTRSVPDTLEPPAAEPDRPSTEAAP